MEADRLKYDFQFGLKQQEMYQKFTEDCKLEKLKDAGRRTDLLIQQKQQIEFKAKYQNEQKEISQKIEIEAEKSDKQRIDFATMRTKQEQFIKRTKEQSLENAQKSFAEHIEQSNSIRDQEIQLMTKSKNAELDQTNDKQRIAIQEFMKHYQEKIDENSMKKQSKKNEILTESISIKNNLDAYVLECKSNRKMQISKRVQNQQELLKQIAFKKEQTELEKLSRCNSEPVKVKPDETEFETYTRNVISELAQNECFNIKPLFK